MVRVCLEKKIICMLFLMVFCITKTWNNLNFTLFRFSEVLYAPQILEYFHDHPTAGHLGLNKMVTRLKQRFFWPRILSDVKYMGSCTICQFPKPSQKKTGGFMVPICPQYPWEYTGVNFMGPLSLMPSGNVYNFVFVHYFLKWIKLCAVREEVLLLWGTSNTQFLPCVLSTDLQQPTTLRPMLLSEWIEHWKRPLELCCMYICFALWTIQHECTGLSPSIVLYGRELDCPWIWILNLILLEWTIQVTSLDALKHSLQKVFDHVRSFLETSHSGKSATTTRGVVLFLSLWMIWCG